MRAGARIAPRPGRPLLHREGAEAAQLDPIAARHGGDDLAEDGVDDVLDVTLIEMRILGGNALNEFGLDHGSPAKRCFSPQFAIPGCQRANKPSRVNSCSDATALQPSSA